MDDVFDDVQNNFGAYIIALIVVILAYTAVSMVAPQYTTGFAVVTLAGIVLYYYSKKYGIPMRGLG
jgi:hypothetical protein